MTIAVRQKKQEQGKASILRAALRQYVRGQNVELSVLAREQGISRATAYRWWGDNNRLLAAVLAVRVEENFAAQLGDNVGKAGLELIVSVVDGFLRHAVASEHLDALLRREPGRTLKIVASSAHCVQSAMVGLFEELLSREQTAGRVELAASAHCVACGIVRLMNAYLYADVVAEEKRDIALVLQLIRLLVSQPQ